MQPAEPTPDTVLLVGETPSTLLPPKARAIAYVITVALAAVYAVVESNVALHYGWQAVYAGWNAAIGALAVSNINN